MDARLRLIMEAQTAQMQAALRSVHGDIGDVNDAFEDLQKTVGKAAELGKAAQEFGEASEEAKKFNETVETIPDKIGKAASAVAKGAHAVASFGKDLSQIITTTRDVIRAVADMDSFFSKAGGEIKDFGSDVLSVADKILILTNPIYGMGRAFMKTTELFTAGAGIIHGALDQTISEIENLSATVQNDRFVKAASQFQVYEAQLKSLTGSLQVARDELKFLSDFATQTPFDLPGLVEADIQLKAFGASTSRFLPVAASLAAVAGRSVPDAATALGKALSGIPEGITQIQESFRVSKKDLIAFGAAVDLQGRIMTNTIGQSEKLALAIEKASQTKFGNILTEQMNTLQGAFANLEDSLGLLQADLGKNFAGAVIAGAKGVNAMVDAVRSLTPVIGVVVGALGDMGESVSFVAKATTAAVGEIVAAFEAIPGAALAQVKAGFDGLTSAIGGTVNAITGFGSSASKAQQDFSALGSVSKAAADTIGTVSSNLGTATLATVGMATAIGVLGAGFTAAGVAVAALLGPIGTAIAGLGGMATAAAAVTGAMASTVPGAAAASTAFTLVGNAANVAAGRTTLLANVLRSALLGPLLAIGTIGVGGAIALANAMKQELEEAKKLAEINDRITNQAQQMRVNWQASTEELRKQGVTAADVSKEILGLQLRNEELRAQGGPHAEEEIRRNEEILKQYREQKKALAELEAANSESAVSAIDNANKIAEAYFKFNQDRQKGIFETAAAEGEVLQDLFTRTTENLEKLKKLREEAEGDPNAGSEENKLRIANLDKYINEAQQRYNQLDVERVQAERRSVTEQINLAKNLLDHQVSLGKIGVKEQIAGLQQILAEHKGTAAERLELQQQIEQLTLQSERAIQDATLERLEAEHAAYEDRVELAQLAAKQSEDILGNESKVAAAIKAKYADELALLEQRHKLEQERTADETLRQENERKFQAEKQGLLAKERDELRANAQEARDQRAEQLSQLGEIKDAFLAINEARLASLEKRFDRGDEAAADAIIATQKRIQAITEARINLERQAALKAENLTAQDKEQINQKFDAKVLENRIQSQEKIAEKEIELAQKTIERKLELEQAEQQVREARLAALDKRFARGDETAGPAIAALKEQIQAAEISFMESEKKKRLIGITEAKERNRIIATEDAKINAAKIAQEQERIELAIANAQKIAEEKQKQIDLEKNQLDLQTDIFEEQVRLGQFHGSQLQRRVQLQAQALDLTIRELRAKEEAEIAGADASDHARIHQDYAVKIEQATRATKKSVDDLNQSYKKGTSELDKHLSKIDKINQLIQQLEGDQEEDNRKKAEGGPRTLEESEAERKREYDLWKAKRDRERLEKDRAKVEAKEAFKDKLKTEAALEAAQRENASKEKQKQGVIDKLKAAGFNDAQVQKRVDEIFGAGTYAGLTAEKNKPTGGEKPKDGKGAGPGKMSEKDGTGSGAGAGNLSGPMTEATGQAILAELKVHTQIGKSGDSGGDGGPAPKPGSKPTPKKPTAKPRTFTPPRPEPDDPYLNSGGPMGVG